VGFDCGWTISGAGADGSDAGKCEPWFAFEVTGFSAVAVDLLASTGGPTRAADGGGLCAGCGGFGSKPMSIGRRASRSIESHLHVAARGGGVGLRGPGIGSGSASERTARRLRSRGAHRRRVGGLGYDPEFALGRGTGLDHLGRAEDRVAEERADAPEKLVALRDRDRFGEFVEKGAGVARAM
jgi:hypothetical protein